MRSFSHGFAGVLAALLLFTFAPAGVALAEDVDGDTREDDQDVVDSPSPPQSTHVAPRLEHIQATPDICNFPCQVPIPYCDSAGRGGLAYRPATGGDPALLAWTTQTTFEDDIVWLCSGDVVTEHARCCGRIENGAINYTVVALAYNDRILCSGGDTMYSGTATNTSGWVYETGLFPPGSATSTRKCAGADQGEDNLACTASACGYLRRFNFAGLDVGDLTSALAVMDPPGVGPLLAASLDVRLYFVDPASPSCAATTVSVIGSCQVLDGATIVNITGLEWVGGNELIAVSSFTDRVYRIGVDFSVSPLTCTILDSCPSPGSEPEAITYDPVANVVYVHDAAANAIFFQGPCSAGTCLVPSCGNGVVESGEQCDDGNTDPTDRCTASCTFTRCGDGVLQAPNGQGTGGPAGDGVEQCDDGNTTSGDGCSNCVTDPVLSVEWLAMDTVCGDAGLILTWQVGDEDMTYGYVVKRGSVEGGPFTVVGEPVWSTGSHSRYEFRDRSPIVTQSWYRIEELCSDPGCSSSPAVQADCLAAGSEGERDRSGRSGDQRRRSRRRQ